MSYKLDITPSYLTNGNNTDIVYTFKTPEGKVLSNLIFQTDSSGNPYVGHNIAEYLCLALESMSNHYNMVNNAKTPLVVGNILIALEREVVRSFTIKHPRTEVFPDYERAFDYYYYKNRTKRFSDPKAPSYFTTLNKKGTAYYVEDIKTGEIYEAFNVKESKTSGYHPKGVEWCSKFVLPHLSPSDPKAFMVALLALSMDDTVSDQEAHALLGTAYNGIVNNLPNIKGLNLNNKVHKVEVVGALQNLSQIHFSSLGTGGIKVPTHPLSLNNLGEICYGIYKDQSKLTIKQLYNQVSNLATVINSRKTFDLNGHAIKDISSFNIRDFFTGSYQGRGTFLTVSRYLENDVALPYYGYLKVYEGTSRSFEVKKGKELEKQAHAISWAIRNAEESVRRTLVNVIITDRYDSDKAKKAMNAVAKLAELAEQAPKNTGRSRR